MTDRYPTDEEFQRIREWDIFERPVAELLDFLESLWWMPDWGFKLTGKRVLRLELHTAGWSGNEDIIAALQQTPMFWMMFWQKSTRGGHYWFRIDLRTLGQ